MNKWTIQRLKNIIQVNPTVKLNKGEIYPFIDIDKISPILRSVKNEEEKLYEGQSCSKFCNGDVIFSRITPCLENRKIAKVSIDKQMAFGSTEFYIFRAEKGISDENFIYYLSSSDAVVLPAINSMTGASGRQRADRRFIENIKLNIPDLSTQRIIANILSTYDDLIEINNKRIKLLEQTVENYFKLSYENEIKNHRVNIVKLSELLDITRGLSYSSEEIECDDGVTLINLKNIQGFGGFRRDGNKCYNGDYKETQVVKQGDLVMGVTDMTQDRRTVGSVALIPDIAGVCVISADLIKIETDINKSFLYCLFRFGNVSKYISQFANGANVLHLKPEVIKKVKVMMPAQEYIKAFSRIVTPMLDEIEMLYQQNDNLIKQRDLLLPRLMSGKLSVETKTESVSKVKKVISFDEFCSNMGMAARAKTISDEDLRAMYEAYIDDDATE